MARVPRSFLPDGVYHVTGRGVDGCGIYRDEDDRRYFLRLVLDAVRRFGWSLHAFCLMGNHLHLVFSSTREALSAGMHAVNGRHAQRFNLRYGRTGHLFGDRFGCRLVEGERYLEDLCRYVEENPLRAGLGELARRWPWSWSRYGKPSAPFRKSVAALAGGQV